MKQIADLHIHSKYSRATSRDCDPEHLDYYARCKGITILGTGDFTHPAWRAELAEKLEPAEDGLYRLRSEWVRPTPAAIGEQAPRFVLSGEISCIYKKDGRTRKVHNLILLPSIEAAEILSRRLEAVGNLHSDGRPILGLDSRDLLEMTLEACPEAIFIPAHIWTPHFSVFGAFSGFETLDECFGDLTPHISALETGLSSDPPMNWRVPALDGYQLVSNSDAHSPQKLGREANLLEIPYGYFALADALSGKDPDGLTGTIEFFPEEGKYHLDGHRSCGVCLTPAETAALGGRCPVCGKKLTIGVENRVEQLAARPVGFRPTGAKPYESLVPLVETIGWSTGTSPTGTRASAQYDAMLNELGNEFFILRECPLEDIRRTAGEVIAEGIRRLRAGEAERIPGYDGQYGVIRLLQQEEVEQLSGQYSLFGEGIAKPRKKTEKKLQIKALISEPESEAAASPQSFGLNEGQAEAVSAISGATAVIAGPGSGKTKTLVARIVHLISDCGVKPSEITAVTFTNQAAEEMRDRLELELGGKRKLRGLTVGTFHSICLRALYPGQKPPLADEERALELAADLLRESGVAGSPRAFLSEISRIRNGCPPRNPDFPADAVERYRELLKEAGLTDFDGLLEEGERWFAEHPAGRSFAHLLVDEFQDSNPIQYRLVRLWGQKAKSLFVIGDPDQAIYGFRGSDSRCFARLAEDFPELRTIFLSENYRSSPEILRASAGVIAPLEGTRAALHANRPSTGRIRLVRAANPTAEGIYIAKEISRLTGGVDMLEAHETAEDPPRSFSEIAILCRTRRQMEQVERCLRHDDLPCLSVGRADWMADDSVRGMVSFFAFLQNPADGDALKHALKFLACPPDLCLRLSQVTQGCSAADWQEAAPLFAEYREIPILQEFFRLCELFAPQISAKKPHALLEHLSEETGQTGENVQQLIRAAAFSAVMPEFLEAWFSGEEDAVRRQMGRVSAGSVTLMTLHAAKGLEFPVVFLYGVEKGSIPLESAERPSDPDEERRLFYVGLTRARERLYLMASGEDSPYLENIPAEVLESVVLKAAPPTSEGTQLSLF
ncbi:MAG: UvrD-helicase domain-containing protein [Candidatus Merdivicinus sp.]|jgi:uncharacterized protein (TIGR00375 family)